MKTIMCFECSFFASADTEEEVLNHMRIHMQNAHARKDSRTLASGRTGVKRSVHRRRALPLEEREKSGATVSDGM